MRRKPLLTRAQVLRFAELSDKEKVAKLRAMTPQDLLRWDADFEQWAHDSQQPPEGEGWRTWLMMAGRGFGKTRAGAEWITSLASQRGRPVRIALVGATAADVRSVMIEGEAGLIAVGRYHGVTPRFEPSLGRVTWPNGSVAQAFSGEAPEQLRGPAHHFAWCDELAKWSRAEETWDNLQLTLRCGERPRALVTTTPRSIALLKRIEAAPRTVVTRGKTFDNPALAENFMAAMLETYAGTRLARQELDGMMVEDVEGALWPRALIEACRSLDFVRDERNGGRPLDFARDERNGGRSLDFARDERRWRRIVVGVDPPASAHGDACGIVVVGLGEDERGYVLDDRTVERCSPERWAAAVARTAEDWGAHRVIAEANQGGAMVESVLRAADCNLPVALVHASTGKSARAEPVAALFERGKAVFAGIFPELEDELAGIAIGGRYEGPGRSPDRADAMVWALTELMLKKKRCPPRIRML